MTERIVFRIFVLVFLLYSAVSNKCPSGGRSESSIVGWMLRAHVYDTLLAELPFTCVFKCREDNRCQSFNWVISLLMREFNNRTKEARPEDFIPNPHRSYYRRDLQRGELSLSAGKLLRWLVRGVFPRTRYLCLALYIWKSKEILLLEVYERLGKLAFYARL